MPPLHDAHQRHDGRMREVGLSDRIAGFIEHLTVLQSDEVEIRLKGRKGLRSRPARSQFVR